MGKQHIDFAGAVCCQIINVSVPKIEFSNVVVFRKWIYLNPYDVHLQTDIHQ